MDDEPPEVPHQAAAIAVRRHGRDLQVCLIRRRNATTWGVPKGLIDPGETPEETALKESWEEAGLRGRVIGNAIGTYTYAKWGTTFLVAVYVMEVLETTDTWEEAELRERRWTSFDAANSLLEDHPVRSLLERASSLSATVIPETTD